MIFVPDRVKKPVFIKPELAPPFRNNKQAYFWHCFEVVYLFKNDISGYKNRVSGNRRIIAAVVVTSLTSAPVLLLGLSIVLKYGLGPNLNAFGFVAPLILAFFGTIGGIFLKEKNSLYEKWKYLASLYNEVLKVEPSKNKDSYKKRELLEVALALDLLEMEMWSHDSFWESFRDTMESAIISFDDGDLSSKKWIIARLSSEGLSKNDAYVFLEAYHAKLFASEKSTA